MPSLSTFELSKWYLDCVADSGRTFIGYAGEMRWGVFRVHHQSILIHDGNKQTCNKMSLWRASLPKITEHQLEWESAPLGVRGTWEALEKPIEATLLDTAEGTVHWRCVQPRARARVALVGGDVVSGLGYAENLRIAIPAWRLPIKELRWGRFLSEQDSLVWIDWRGPHPRSWLYYNGVPVTAQHISEQSVVAKEGQAILEMSDARVLRAGSALESAFAGIARLLRLLPHQLRGMHECKWLSRGTLKRAGATDQIGWVIHEVVKWP